MQHGAAQRLTPEQARTTTTCTKCHAAHGGNAYVVEKRDSGFGQAGFQAVPVDLAFQPTYSHCAKCATAYAKRLTRRQERKQLRQRCKAAKTNLKYADCTIVAVALTTGLGYDRVEIIAKRKYGYSGGTRGLCTITWGQLLEECASIKGKTVVPRADLIGKTPEQVAASAGKATIALSCNHGAKGHAVPIVKGQAHNASGGTSRWGAIFAWEVV